MDDSELKALVSLLEDDELRPEIERKILGFGTTVIPFLETEWEQCFDSTLQGLIENIIHKLQFDLLQERLVNWRQEESDDLLKGMWLVATYQYPDLDLQKLRQDLEQLYYEVWLEHNPDGHYFDQVKMMNSVFFSKLKYRSNTQNFHSPANSNINIVMESRRGNPITLCVVYLLVAQKLDMPVYGVNLPNMFILTYKTEETQFYINAFNRGLIFSKDDIDSYIAQINLTPRPMFYDPCTNLDIVVRVLRNLIVSFEKLDEHYKADDIKVLLALLES
jgi:regulator of sirC expression with transglutaminase-like and TPR domain